MISEVNLFGVYVSPIVVDALVAIPLFVVLRWLLGKAGILRRVWHPALFQMSLYVCVVCVIALRAA